MPKPRRPDVHDSLQRARRRAGGMAKRQDAIAAKAARKAAKKKAREEAYEATHEDTNQIAYRVMQEVIRKSEAQK